MYRYSDIVENQRVISYQIKNSQVVTNVQHLNFIPNIGKIFVIFIELYKKWTFVHINSYKNLEKKATLGSRQKCVNGLFRNLSDI